MRILDRYILKSVLSLFFQCLFTFLFLYVIIDIFSHLDEILKQQVNISILGQYYLAYLPIIFVQVSPIACLLSTLYTFGTLNRNNEMIAMRSAGLSIPQIIKTALIFGLIVSACVFWVNDKFVPASMSLTERIKKEMESGTRKAKEKEHEVITNLSMYGLKNRLFFVNKFSLAANTMEGIIILEHDEKQNITKKIVANKGAYKDGLWRFYQSITYNFDENVQIKEEPQYMEEEIMNIPETPHDFLNQMLQPDYMTISQLDNYMRRLSTSGATTVIRNLKVDLYQRFTFPLTSIMIMLLGIPFSVMMKKRATGLSSVGLSLILGFLYYVLNAISIALGKSGALTPILAVSLSHILAFLTAFYLIHKLP
ncbi:MAG: LptF/LptG family permease [Candidatus Omnitrophica bacterium]|nr:LptF/LptG family permease [Candidatus Omnitrophota bacterium]MDD5592985.1 LptF/LptG family permease [Candidatus Omnitrophota bacterium]